MLKFGWVLLVSVAVLIVFVSCTCDKVTTVAPTSDAPVLAPSPMETTDGSLKGDGWYYGQTPQSYNTGKNQVPASEEEVKRVQEELKKLETESE